MKVLRKAAAAVLLLAFMGGIAACLGRSGKDVAQIGDVKYKTLQEAVKAAPDNCVIELLTDVTESVEIGSKTFTINLNDNTISGGTVDQTDVAHPNTLVVNTGAHITLNGPGVIDGSENAILVCGGNLTVNGSTVLGSKIALLIADGGTATVNDALIGLTSEIVDGKAMGSDFKCDGCVVDSGSLTFNSGSIGGNKIGVFLSPEGEFHMNGGAIAAGMFGVFLDNLDVEDNIPVFEMTGGTIDSGFALLMGEGGRASISGGTLTGHTGDCLANDYTQAQLTNGTYSDIPGDLNITGGTFICTGGFVPFDEERVTIPGSVSLIKDNNTTWRVE